jgi:integrase/recombinase XerD
MRDKMNNKPPALQSPALPVLAGQDLASVCQDWLLYGDLEDWSERTLSDRRAWLDRFRDWAEVHHTGLNRDGLTRWFVALKQGAPGTRCRKPLSPAYLKHAHVLFKAFCAWLVAEGKLDTSPMLRIPAPVLRDEKIHPFTDEEINRILAAARKTRLATRNVAIVYFLADTGIRASEMCALRVANVELSTRTALIARGKGGKSRQISFGEDTAKALFKYLKEEPHEADDPLFLGERGEQMNRDSLRHLCERLGRLSGVQRVHAHRFRHDAAVKLLRNGAHVFGVMALLGHSRVGVTERYVRLAEADVQAVHRLASPMDCLKAKRR